MSKMTYNSHLCKQVENPLFLPLVLFSLFVLSPHIPTLELGFKLFFLSIPLHSYSPTSPKEPGRKPSLSLLTSLSRLQILWQHKESELRFQTARKMKAAIFQGQAQMLPQTK
ncbi:hypothetical protein AMTRI_Chr10g3220 [Amborella trichopoda]